MRILVVENHRETPVGAVGSELERAGAILDIVRPLEGDPLPRGADAHAGLMILGGPQSATDDAGHPYYPALLDLIRAYAAAGKPVFGICLGSQLVARAFGATVRSQGWLEVGFGTVTLTTDARDDPVFGVLGAVEPVLHWHYDTFDLPPGARLLARGAACENQAFRIGGNIYGVQFHPEVDADLVAAWLAPLPRPLTTDFAALATALGGAPWPRIEQLAVTLASRWLALAGAA
ncbi:MAG: type 1 glutamine amidotransferase [Azospirillaceae bacterium]|nr:type 1 glutamine amidotransferase [Azospirillaceae bacterium]